jgi:hypothetical protein
MGCDKASYYGKKNNNVMRRDGFGLTADSWPVGHQEGRVAGQIALIQDRRAGRGPFDRN